MRGCGRSWVVLLVVVSLGGGIRGARAEEAPNPSAVHRVFPAGQFPPDGRLLPTRYLRDLNHPWTPPSSLIDWDAARARIRTQLLVACGLWPLPLKTPIEPVIHGLVDREDYTVERVFFSSRPGVYVTGSLYRPKGFEGPRPAVLNPHGHWANGRFYVAGMKEAEQQIEAGAETLMSAALHPLQARMVQLARMGCVVFHYDMIGYADQGPLAHASGFNDVEAELRSQNIMGLQTWNSVRALDFVASLPDVDPARIGVTGASGGGTQTFVLGAIDPRPAVAFPAVMVSANMQGGCVCENASYLRLGLNNVAFAACFAPKPLGMTGADDWTIDIETKGLPELKQIWGLYDQFNKVEAKCFPQFGHNYNQVSRGQMYAWMNQHLGLGVEGPITEREFTPLTQADLTVFTAEHPRPEDALVPEQLRSRLTEESLLWYADLLERSQTGPAEYRAIVGPATEIIFGGPAPAAEQIDSEILSSSEVDEVRFLRGWCSRRNSDERIPWVLLLPKPDAEGKPKFSGEVTVWIDGRGKHALFDAAGRPIHAVRRLLDQGQAVVEVDVFLTGEFLPLEVDASRPINRTFAGYTLGYNRPLIAERVRDIVTVASAAAGHEQVTQVHLVGTRAAGPWVLIARGQLGDKIGRTLVDLGDFSFAGQTSTQDPDFLPGALKFGGLGGLLALAGPITVEVANAGENAQRELEPFVALGGMLKLSNDRMTPARDE